MTVPAVMRKTPHLVFFFGSVQSVLPARGGRMRTHRVSSCSSYATIWLMGVSPGVVKI